MRNIPEYMVMVEKGLADLHFPDRPKELYDPLRYILTLGGKRMRPVLLLMAHELFGGKAENALPQAIAIELFHNFSLIHDDIMDNAPLRRGKKTVHEKWNSNVGILSGDAMLVIAYQQMSKCAADKLPEVVRVFNRTAIEVCEGQQYDMEFETRDDVSIEEYINMIALKTSVLLGGALEIGAILANANKKDAEHLNEFGKNLGVAFQLQDDLLDAYGDPDKFGKKVGGDIIANKKTYLVLKALKDADANQNKELQQLIQSVTIPEETKIRQVLELFNALSIPEKTRMAMDEYYAKSIHHLNAISLDASKKAPLEKLAESLMVREH
ncbi:MAG: polyprenyl synthetase family protein [Flavobacteriales bacterium]